MRNFPCNKCGKCCTNVHLSKITSFLDRGDGACRHFDCGTKLCTIYAARPDICRIDLQYETNYAEHWSWDDFVESNLAVCKSLPERELDC